jgi:hypothetical protein
MRQEENEKMAAPHFKICVRARDMIMEAKMRDFINIICPQDGAGVVLAPPREALAYEQKFCISVAYYEVTKLR